VRQTRVGRRSFARRDRGDADIRIGGQQLLRHDHRVGIEGRGRSVDVRIAVELGRVVLRRADTGRVDAVALPAASATAAPTARLT
jgi:hypothetical protein